MRLNEGITRVWKMLGRVSRPDFAIRADIDDVLRENRIGRNQGHHLWEDRFSMRQCGSQSLKNELRRRFTTAKVSVSTGRDADGLLGGAAEAEPEVADAIGAVEMSEGMPAIDHRARGIFAGPLIGRDFAELLPGSR